MLTSMPSEPVLQTMVYMVAIVGGYALATAPGEWAEVWATVRAIVRRRQDRQR